MHWLKAQFDLAWQFYRKELKKIHSRCLCTFLLLCLGGGLVFRLFAPQAEAVLRFFMESVQQSGVMTEEGGVSLWALFGNNLRASLTAAAMGLVPFLFLPALSLVINGVVIGVVLSVSDSLGLAVWQMVLLGLAPHGVFEIPAITLGITMGLWLCRQMNGMIRKRPDTPTLEEILPQLVRVSLLFLVPLLAAAALIETFLTPVLLGLVQ